MAAPAGRVLYLHPYNHPQDDVVPVGSITAMNLLSGAGVLGRYASEVSEEEVRAARVVAMDVHWFPPLAVLDGMLAGIRHIQPDVPVVVGGITAAFYGRALLERFDVDHVVGGDVELTLPELVGCLVDGRPPPALPGVWSRGVDDPPQPPARLPTERFDRLDALTIDWFPTLRRRVVDKHAMHRRGRQVPSDPGFPTLLVSRGCARDCEFCHGSYQGRVFGSGTLCRTAEGLLRDLERLSRDPEIAFVTVFLGDGLALDTLASAVEGADLDLDGFLFFCGSAAPASLRAWRSAFRGDVVFSVIQPSDLASGPPTFSPDALERVLGGLPAAARAAVYHVSEPEPAAVRVARSDERIELASARDWTLVRPDAARAPDTASRARQLDQVIAASRCLAAYNLLIALVPDLVRHGLPAAIELPSLERRLAGATDPFVRGLLEALIRQIEERGIYGCDSLRIRWTVREVAEGSETDWLSPSGPGVGDARWCPALRGFAWEGEVTLPSQRPWMVAPCPCVVVDGREFDLSTWQRARLPAVAVESGPGRSVRVVGRTSGGRLGLGWTEGDPPDAPVPRMRVIRHLA